MVSLTGNNTTGSTLLIQQQQRAVSVSFSAYGNPLPETESYSTMPGFNGMRRDPETGSSHLGNGYRAYSPVLMRFSCPDSLSPFGSGGINAYAYCNADPVNHVDPSGHMKKHAMSWMMAGFAKAPEEVFKNPWGESLAEGQSSSSLEELSRTSKNAQTEVITQATSINTLSAQDSPKIRARATTPSVQTLPVEAQAEIYSYLNSDDLANMARFPVESIQDATTLAASRMSASQKTNFLLNSLFKHNGLTPLALPDPVRHARFHGCEKKAASLLQSVWLSQENNGVQSAEIANLVNKYLGGRESEGVRYLFEPEGAGIVAGSFGFCDDFSQPSFVFPTYFNFVAHLNPYR